MALGDPIDFTDESTVSPQSKVDGDVKCFSSDPKPVIKRSQIKDYKGRCLFGYSDKLKLVDCNSYDNPTLEWVLRWNLGWTAVHPLYLQTSCLDVDEKYNVYLNFCTFVNTQLFLFDVSGKISSGKDYMCLDSYYDEVTLSECAEYQTQHWTFSFN